MGSKGYIRQMVYIVHEVLGTHTVGGSYTEYRGCMGLGIQSMGNAWIWTSKAWSWVLMIKHAIGYTEVKDTLCIASAGDRRGNVYN